MKRFLTMALCGGLLLSACGGAVGNTKNTTEKQMTDAENETVEVTDSDEASVFSSADAGEFAGVIDNSTIDTGVYLDYSAGIEAGVYKWVLSEDKTYYTLAAVDENGEPLEAKEAAINVGANNEETGGMGVMKPGEQGKGSPSGSGFLDGSKEMGERNEKPQDAGESGGGHGGMMGSMGGGGTVYQGVYMNANITNISNQTMAVYVPAAYFETDEDGNVTGINHKAAVKNYTADTAPIIYLNECGGWRSSSPRSCDMSYIEEGMLYVTAGARSRDAVGEDGTRTGKAPTQMADLKSGVIELRANEDVIPGDKDKIISVGTSGGGQMSSVFGASGNMSEYYPYMYEAGTLGVTKNEDGTFSSAYADNIYAAQNFCPIADIENADLAYAWWWVNLADKGGVYNGSITDFEKRLQELEADAFVEYLNSLGLEDADGNALELTDLREGSYYEKILENVSDALNAAVNAGEVDPAKEYPDSSDWLVQDGDGKWTITDLDGFMIGTGMAEKRNKAIPGFDPMDKSAENDAFGTPNEEAVHFSASVAQVLSDNYDELSALDGFDKEQVDTYIEEALTGSGAKGIATQANLLNATEILLGSNGSRAVDPVKYFRNRSGTADQHTSFSVGYNIMLAAQMADTDVDYSLVWDMEHGNNEGESTGTFIDWVNEICAE